MTSADYDALMLAQALLLSTREPSAARRVWAYRLLAASNRGYSARLAQALLEYGYDAGHTAGIRVNLAAEAVAAARQIDPKRHARASLLLARALEQYQFELYAAGLAEQGLAVRAEIVEHSRRTNQSRLARSLSSLATGLAQAGRLGEAVSCAAEAVEVSEREGGSAWVRYRMEWANHLGAAGEVDRALRVLEELAADCRIGLARGTGDPAEFVRVTMSLARMLADDNQPQAAAETLRESVAVYRSIPAIPGIRSHADLADGLSALEEAIRLSTPTRSCPH